MGSGFGVLDRPKSKSTPKKDETCQEVDAGQVDHRQLSANTAVNKLFSAMAGLPV
jgi:hypothetical protein